MDFFVERDAGAKADVNPEKSKQVLVGTELLILLTCTKQNNIASLKCEFTFFCNLFHDIQWYSVEVQWIVLDSVVGCIGYEIDENTSTDDASLCPGCLFVSQGIL